MTLRRDESKEKQEKSHIDKNIKEENKIKINDNKIKIIDHSLQENALLVTNFSDQKLLGTIITNLDTSL